MSKYSEHEDSCKAGGDCGCGHSHSCGSHGCNCAKNFIKIADHAWVEVLKEKIKDQILKHKGAELDKLAEIVATANSKKWKHKIASRLECDEYKNSLRDFFSL